MALPLFLFVLLSFSSATCSQKAPVGKIETTLASELTQRYFSNEELEAFMLNFTSSPQCSNISRMFRQGCPSIRAPVGCELSVGESVSGTELWVLEISIHPGISEAKPNVKYIANLHGNEPSGRQLLMTLAEWLCENWESDERASTIVNDLHLYLMPTANPDGYARGTRENKCALSVECVPKGEGAFMEPTGKEAPETLALMKWILEGYFVSSLSLHEGALVANYPWDAGVSGHINYAASPDDDTFVYISKIYANSHLTMNASREFAGGITNGNEWYPVYGGMQDYNYIAGNCMELTTELSDDKHPHVSQLERLWNENKDAFLNFAITTALHGFSGVVVGSDETPLEAKISIKGIPKDYFTRPQFGDFYRPLKPGNYRATISAEGYESLRTKIVVPESGGAEYRYVLKSLGSAHQLRTIRASSTTAVQPTNYRTPLLVMAVAFPVFVVVALRSSHYSTRSR